MTDDELERSLSTLPGPLDEADPAFVTRVMLAVTADRQRRHRILGASLAAGVATAASLLVRTSLEAAPGLGLTGADLSAAISLTAMCALVVLTTGAWPSVRSGDRGMTDQRSGR